MAEVQPNWQFPLVDVTATRKGNRTATPPGMASRIIGADGNDIAGLRPSAGFRKVVDLRYGYGNDALLAANGGLDAGGTLLDFFPVTFRVGDSKYAYGFVYRVMDDDLEKTVIRVVFRVGNDDLTWHTDHALGFTSGLTGADSYFGEQMHVEVFGRFVYVLRSSLTPVMFYVTEPTPGTYTLVVNTDTGPGAPPTISNPSKNSVSAHVVLDSGNGRTADKDLTDVVTVMAPPTGVDADAKVVYFGFSGLSKVSLDNSNFRTNPNLYVRNPAVTGGLVDTNIVGPSTIGLWATPPQADPSWFDVASWNGAGMAAYAYPVPPGGPQNERYKWGWNRGARQATEPMGFNNNFGFVWAYQLYDTRTGRRSLLSNRMLSDHDGYGATAVEEVITVNSSGNQVSSMLRTTFPMFQIIYDHAKYDTVRLYRGRPAQGLNQDEVLLSLEGEVTLASYLIDTQPVNPAWKVAAYFPKLSESEISQQETFIGDDVSLEQMPAAGSALIYEGSMLLGKMGEIDDKIGGLGKFVWSSLNDVSVEIVPASNRYPLQIPDEEIERFCRLGPNVVGFSKVTQYLIRREINYLKAQPMHMGFGVVGARAACEVGSDVYFLTEHGLQGLSASGKLDDIHVIDDIIQRTWSGHLGQVEMAFDSTPAIVFVLSPLHQHIAAMYLRTGKLIEFLDVPFLHVTEGNIPYNVELAGSPLQRRAVFVQYAINGGFEPSKRFRVFVYDYDRSSGKIQLLHPDNTCDSIFTLYEEVDPTDDVIKTNQGVGTDIEGCYLYVLSGPHAGNKHLVKWADAGDTFKLSAQTSVRYPIDTVFGLSPMYYEWIGSQLGMVSENGMAFSSGYDYFATRHVDSLNCVFVDVDGATADTNTARFQGAIYSGTSVTAEDVRFPQDNQRGVVQSVVEGVSVYAAAFSDPSGSSVEGRSGVAGNALFPSVRIYTPNLDFRLLSVVVVGTIRSMDALRSRE